MLPLYKPEDYKRVLETALLVAAEPLAPGRTEKAVRRGVRRRHLAYPA
jgi:hypothetical protein